MYPLDRTTCFGKAGCHSHYRDKKQDNNKIGKLDIEINPAFFKTFDKTVEQKHTSEKRRGIYKKNSIIVANNW